MYLMHIRKSVLASLMYLVYLLLALQPATAAESDPHKDLRDIYACEECHLGKPRGRPGPVYSGRKGALIRSDITKPCTRCHKYGDRSHPTDIKPKGHVPPDLPLINNMITCATCHYPHMPAESTQQYIPSGLLSNLFSSGSSHKTYFLRRTNVNGEMCKACHK